MKSLVVFGLIFLSFARTGYAGGYRNGASNGYGNGASNGYGNGGINGGMNRGYNEGAHVSYAAFSHVAYSLAFEYCEGKLRAPALGSPQFALFSKELGQCLGEMIPNFER